MNKSPAAIRIFPRRIALLKRPTRPGNSGIQKSAASFRNGSFCTDIQSRPSVFIHR